MRIEEIKKELESHVGDHVIIKYHLGRNKYEEYTVKIKELYDYVFLVETKEETKSFSYSDVIAQTIRILY